MIWPKVSIIAWLVLTVAFIVTGQYDRAVAAFTVSGIALCLSEINDRNGKR